MFVFNIKGGPVDLPDYKIGCVIFVKDNGRYLGSCLREAVQVTPDILVLKKASTDCSPQVSPPFPGVHYQFLQSMSEGEEGKAMELAIRWAEERRADWLLLLESCEVLEEGAADTIHQEISRLDPRDPIYAFFYLRLLYFWADPELYRCEDSTFGDAWEPRLFYLPALEGQDLLLTFGQPTSPNRLKGKGRKMDLCLKSFKYLDPSKSEEAGICLAQWTPRNREEIVPGLFIKPIKYHQFVPPEVAKLVPPGAKKILEIGCGQGILGHLLKREDPTREVVGVEANRMAAAAAMRRLDYVIVADVEKATLDFPLGYFDCLILLGVLEHLFNPWDILLYLKRFLRPDGYLLLSVPNVRNWTVLGLLINEGRWLYSDSGILDRAHLRFFTLRDIKELLASLHFVPEEICCLPDPAIPGSSGTGLVSISEAERITWKKFSLGELKELKTKEYLIKAKLCLPQRGPKDYRCIK